MKNVALINEINTADETVKYRVSTNFFYDPENCIMNFNDIISR